MTRKKVDDVLGGEEMWKDADSTTSSVLSILFAGEIFTCLFSNL